MQELRAWGKGRSRFGRSVPTEPGLGFVEAFDFGCKKVEIRFNSTPGPALP